MLGKTAVPKKTKYAEHKERALKRILQRIEKRKAHEQTASTSDPQETTIGDQTSVIYPPQYWRFMLEK